MKSSAASIKELLLRKHETGRTIQLLRVSCEVLKTPDRLTHADLLLMDHSSTSPGFNPASDLLPLANANEALLQNAERHRDLIARFPTVAGICGTDPFRIPEKLLAQIKELGFVGVQNSPSIGLIDGKFRKHLENSRLSYDQEVAMLKLAKQLELLVVATVFSEQDMQKMLGIGADILIVHPGPKGLLSDYKDWGTTNPLCKKLVSIVPTESKAIVLPWTR